VEFGDAGMGRLPDEDEIWSVVLFLYDQTGWSRAPGKSVRREQMIHALLLVKVVMTQDSRPESRFIPKWCAGCHGDNGAGDGGAPSHDPAPRDFTARSTRFARRRADSSERRRPASLYR